MKGLLKWRWLGCTTWICRWRTVFLKKLALQLAGGHIAACIADNSQRACIVTLSMDLELVWHMVWPGQPSPQFAKQSKGGGEAKMATYINPGMLLLKPRHNMQA